jgi:hypothetical protein
VAYAEFSDAITVAWINAAEYGASGSGTTFSFLATLFEDGTVLIVHGSAPTSTSYPALDALVGWACYNAAQSFTEVNLSSVVVDRAGYWGYGTGTEYNVYELFSSSSTDRVDVYGRALRFCANPSNNGLAHCAE